MRRWLADLGNEAYRDSEPVDEPEPAAAGS
jgi:hypothetical protein